MQCIKSESECGIKETAKKAPTPEAPREVKNVPPSGISLKFFLAHRTSNADKKATLKVILELKANPVAPRE